MIFRRRLSWAVVVVALVSAGRVDGQVQRLPSVIPVSDAYVARTISHPDSPAEVPQPPPEFLSPDPNRADSPWQLPDGMRYRYAPGLRERLFSEYDELPSDPSLEMNPDRPPDARDGMFQKLVFSSNWLDVGGAQGLGMVEMDLRSVLALPCPTRDSPLIITPGYGISVLEWSGIRDLPSSLHSAYVQFRFMRRINPRLAIDVAVSPGVFSDYEQGADEMIRVPGHGAVIWTLSPTAKLVGGVGRFDRLDVDVLPVGGLIWTPNEDTKFEILFPKPKLARRINSYDSSSGNISDWLYVAGEFGGSTWAIRRASGANDVLNYRDLRLILGVERKAIGTMDYRFEVGYVFGRELEYGSGTPKVEPSDTVMIRAGMTY